MISKEDFIKKCDELIPQEEMEKYNKANKKMWLTLIITLAVEGLVSWLIYMAWEYIFYILPFVAVISVVIVVINLKYKWGDFKKTYSKGVLDVLFEGFNYQFDSNKCIGQSVFKSSCFAAEYDSYRGEDLLKVDIPNDDGTTSGVNLSLCDLYVTKQETRTVSVKNSDGSISTREETYTVTIYNGVFGYVYFPFKFKCDLSINVRRNGHDRIKLEDVKFNKVCKVYTNNQLEALVILTPTLMNKLKTFAERVRGFKIYITEHGTMYFGMSRNIFELSKSFRKPTGKVFERFYDDVHDILLMVNEIKDNNKVFKM